MPFAEAADYRFNPFDLTKVWPKGDYPLIEVGKMTLNRNPENFFAEVEQSTFKPANLVPGTGLSPDKMLMARIFSYHDTHLHRVGVNHEQLPINAPHAEVNSYTRDGHMTYRNDGNVPNYAPNTKGGPEAAGPEHGADLGWDVEAAELGRYANRKHAEDDDFVQARTLYNEVMEDVNREALVEGIVGHASKPEVTDDMHERVIAYWANVDADLGAKVAAGLGKDNGQGSNGSGPASPEATRAAGRAREPRLGAAGRAARSSIWAGVLEHVGPGVAAELVAARVGLALAVAVLLPAVPGVVEGEAVQLDGDRCSGQRQSTRCPPAGRFVTGSGRRSARSSARKADSSRLSATFSSPLITSRRPAAPAALGRRAGTALDLAGVVAVAHAGFVACAGQVVDGQPARDVDQRRGHGDGGDAARRAAWSPAPTTAGHARDAPLPRGDHLGLGRSALHQPVPPRGGAPSEDRPGATGQNGG